MIILASALVALAGLIALISGIWMLALAFHRNLYWGLAVLCFPVGNVAFLFANWREARSPFFLGAGSLGLLAAAFMAMPEGTIRLPSRVAAAVEQRQAEEARQAEEKMAAVREEAEVQLQLIQLKAREQALAVRKAAVLRGEAISTAALSAEIHAYNAELQPVLARLH